MMTDLKRNLSQTLFMAMTASLLPFLSADTVPSSSLGNDGELVHDYVAFHRFQNIYVINAGDKKQNLWSLRIISYLSVIPSSTLRVLPAKEMRLLAFHNSTSADMLNITMDEKGGGSPGEEAHSEMSLKIEIDPQSRSTLIVCRLRTTSELQLFQRVFAENQNVGHWLLLTDASHLQRLYEVYLPIDNQIVMTTFTENGHIANFWESYQVTENLPQNRQIIGRWWRRGAWPAVWNMFPFKHVVHPQEKASSKDVKSKFKGLKYGVASLSSDERVKWRRDLSGLHLTCVTIQSYPLSTLHHQGDGSMKEGGVLHSLMSSLARQLNFTYSCHEVADKQWGTYSKGNWTGMIGEVLYGKADIAVAPLDITLLRSQVVDYVIPLVASGYKMIMKRPNTQDVFWTVYTRLFPAVLWSCVVSTTALMMIFLVLAKRNKDFRRHLSLLDAFTAIVRYGCGQGNDLELYHTSERLIAFLAQMFFKFLGAYYTCFLVSSLAAGPPEPKLVSLQDVLETSMTLGVVEGTAPVEYFKESPDHLHRKVWQSLRRKNFAAIAPNLETAMRRVRTEPYVLVEWDVHLKYKYESDCQLFILPTSYFQAKSSIALKKGSPYVALLSSVILEMLESGILEKWSRELKRKRQDHCNVEINPVDFKTITSLIMLLTTAVIAAIVFMPVEMLWSNWLRKIIQRRRIRNTL